MRGTVTDKRFCKICGELIPPESTFCLKCGADLRSTAMPQREVTLLHAQQNEFSDVRSEYTSQPYPSSGQGLLSDLGVSFWLGFVGGVFGILGGVFAWMIRSLRGSYER
jgi:predicted nucleic acid-binding Zn ribbon protein